MSELNKLLKQFIGSNQVDGSKILLENNESIRAKKADGSEKSVLKVNSSDKLEFSDDVYVGQEKLASDSGVDAKVLVEKQRAEAAESQLSSSIQTVDGKVDAEKLRAEGVEAQLSSSITSGVAEAKSHAETKASEAEVNAKSYADTQNAAKLVEAKAYTDTKISELIGGAPASTLDTIKEIADALQSEQTATGSILSQLSTLSSDVADVEAYAQDIASDLAAEITNRQSAVNSLDQKVDGNYDILSGDIELLRSDVDATQALISQEAGARIAADSSLNTRVTALEARPGGDQYSPFTSLMTESNLAYVDLDREVKAIMSAAIGHLVAREGKDFSKSVVGGVTRITFINGFAQNGGTPVQPNQEFHCVYAYQA
jgi:hypothetical protein